MLINAYILYYWCGGSVWDFQQRTQFKCRIVLCPKSGDFLFLCCGLWPNKTTRPRQPWEQPDRYSGPQEIQTTEILESLISHIRTLQFPSDFGGGAAYCNCNLLHSLVLQQHSSCSWALANKKPDLGDPAARLVSSGP